MKALTTERLILEPIEAHHAEEMAIVLADPELYLYIARNAPDATELKETYQRWSTRRSPAGDEIWWNWVGRLKATGELVGHFQTTTKENGECVMGYAIGLRFQRNGYAFEGLKCIFEHLKSDLQIKCIKASIDTRNSASIQLAKKLGMKSMELIKNEELIHGVWCDTEVFGLEW